MRWIVALTAVAAASSGCDAGLQPEPVCATSLIGLCGRLRFQGTVPANTDNVFVAAYLNFPQTCLDVINNRQPIIPGSVPFTDSATDYSIALPPGTYHWVLAVWKKPGPFTLTVDDTQLVRVAGYYRNPADSSQPGSVLVPNGAAAADINFVVNFDSLRPATDFVTCTAQ